MPPKKNAKKVNEPEKQNKGPSDPAKSNKPSNSSAQKSGNSAGMFLFVIIVSAALGFGLKTYVDQEVTQIDANVEAIFKKIEPLLNSGLQSTIKDVPEIKEMLRSLKEEVASLDQQLSSLSGSVTKLDGQLQHSIESMGNKLAQSKEERQKFEEAISDKIVMWEGTTSSQLADMLAQVVSAKQLSEKAHSSSKEAEESLKHEFTSAVSRLVEEYQNYEAKVITANQQLKDLQGQVQGLMDEQDEADAEDLKTDLENFRKEINDVTGALRHLQDGVKQSTDRIDSQVTSIGLEVRKASEDAKKMRDDVNSLSASLNKIKQGQVGSKKP